MVYQYHPDQCTDQDKTECETMFKKVTEARDVLINYCTSYRYSFIQSDVERVRLDKDYEYEHMKRFYEDWMI